MESTTRVLRIRIQRDFNLTCTIESSNTMSMQATINIIIPFIQQVPLKFPLQLKWRCGPDMPFAMSDHLQSVVVQGTIYVGGGYAGRGSDDNYVIMAFDVTYGKWTTLPPYRTCFFAMSTINNQLVLVGGEDHGSASKVLGVWCADNKQWTYPYPEMHTARSECSAVVYNEWLVVAGGFSVVSGGVFGRKPLSSVEVMNIDSKEWFAGPPTPAPWYHMKTATVGDVWYFMGGCSTLYKGTNMVYSVSLSALTTGMNSSNASRNEIQIWKEVSELQTTFSFPLSISGSLLAVGGKDKYRDSVTAIHLYQPGTGEWVKVGDLPAPPRCEYTCAMITDREMLVAGGCVVSRFKRMDIALIINC